MTASCPIINFERLGVVSGFRAPLRCEPLPTLPFRFGQLLHNRLRQKGSSRAWGSKKSQHQIRILPSELRKRETSRPGMVLHGFQTQSSLFGQFHTREYVMQNRIAAEHGSDECLQLLKRDRFNRPARATNFNGVRCHHELALCAIDAVVAMDESIDDAFTDEFKKGCTRFNPPSVGPVDKIR